MRIWHQSVAEEGTTPRYFATLRERADRLLRGRATVEVHGLARGSYGGLAPSQVFGHPSLVHHALGQIVDLSRRAEAQGFDALVVGSFSDPYLAEIRSSVRIPVVSTLEAAVLTALMVGNAPRVVTSSAAVQAIIAARLRDKGLRSNAVTSDAFEPGLMEPELEAGFSDPAQGDGIVAGFIGLGERGVHEAGADVIVPGEGILNELLMRAGVKRIAGAPVLDSFAAAWETAWTLAGRGSQPGPLTPDPNGLPDADVYERVRRAATATAAPGGGRSTS